MSRDRCWECGNQLAWVPKKGVVFEVYVDPMGHSHKLHKECFKDGSYASKPVTARPKDEVAV